MLWSSIYSPKNSFLSDLVFVIPLCIPSSNCCVSKKVILSWITLPSYLMSVLMYWLKRLIQQLWRKKRVFIHHILYILDPSINIHTSGLQHHSRDTVEKQWNETRSIALKGVFLMLLKLYALDCKNYEVDFAQVAVLTSIDWYLLPYLYLCCQ